MRIGIDARPLQLDSYRERGIGTHLRGWISAAQQFETGLSFHLLFDPALPPPAIGLTSPEWHLQALKLPFSPPWQPPTALHLSANDEFLFDSAMEAFLLENSIDLFHATYTFMWEAFVARRLFHTRLVVTFYDLIPLLFRNMYLEPLGERGYQSFAQRLGAVVYAQRVQTLSAATRDDLVSTTGVSPDKVDLIGSGIDEAFSQLESREEVAKRLAELGLSGRYIFSVSGGHYTKNLPRLLTAYSRLPSSVRAQVHLVVLASLSHELQAALRRQMGSLGIEDQVSFLRKVSQGQLVALYNGAELVVHPALYEGFGLPIVEAMRCGTPVVASNCSSIPEITGDAARLVDPNDPDEIARGMLEVLGSETLRSELRERGLRQSAQFTWERTARATLDSYRRALEEPLYSLTRAFPVSYSRASRRLRLAFWTPLNPRPSGVSDYSELLIAELGKEADIDIFVDGYQPSNLPLFDSFPVFDGKAYEALATRRPYDINLYQVGNNPIHGHMYAPIRRWPGIITLHDFYIYNFVHAAFLAEKRMDDFWAEMAYCEGPDVARRARADYLRGALDDYKLAMNRRIVEASRGVVVHSQWSRERLEQYHDVPPIRVIPFGTLILDDDGGRFGRVVRRLLGLPEKGFVFGVFGNLHRVKRLPVVFRTFERLRQRSPDTYLYVMGPVDISAADAVFPLQNDPAGARARGIHLHLTYASYDLMLMAMQAVDAAINLRFPTAGETSGTLSMLLGQGKPTIVSDVGSFCEYPDACCPKVPVNDQEEETLLRHMLALRDKSCYNRAVQAAYAYARDKTWRECAKRYLEFIEDVLHLQ